jgi:hypothetical protein
MTIHIELSQQLLSLTFLTVTLSTLMWYYFNRYL